MFSVVWARVSKFQGSSYRFKAKGVSRKWLALAFSSSLIDVRRATCHLRLCDLRLTTDLPCDLRLATYDIQQNPSSTLPASSRLYYLLRHPILSLTHTLSHTTYQPSQPPCLPTDEHPDQEKTRVTSLIRSICLSAVRPFRSASLDCKLLLPAITTVTTTTATTTISTTACTRYMSARFDQFFPTISSTQWLILH